MLNDCRQAIRLFRHSPGFSAAVVLTLGLGIALTSAMFSVVDGVLLRPLPYANPTALLTTRSVTNEAWLEWRSRTSAMTDIATYDFGQAPLLLAGEEPTRITRAAISANLLPVLGVHPALGRNFSPADSERGAEPVAILTHAVWQQHFGGRTNIVGQLAPFEPGAIRVIGILPERFVFPMRLVQTVGEVRILTPIPVSVPPGYTFGVVARLRDDATLAHARAEELAIVRARDSGMAHSAQTISLSTAILGDSQYSLLLLSAAVVLLLMIACANVGNLLFARATEARRELAVRLALGAQRRQLVRFVLVQSCTLSLAGGLLGVVVAYWTFDTLMAVLPAPLPRVSAVRIDGRVLGFAFVLSFVSGAVLGLLPALQVIGVNLQQTLRGDERTTTPTQRLRLTLLATEVALAVLLLAGAGLAANSFVRLLSVDLGFSVENVLSLRMRGPDSRYPTPDQQRELLTRALERLAALPGVVSVGAGELLPVTRARRGGSVTAMQVGHSSQPVGAELRVITAGFLETMSIHAVKGRSFNRRDDNGSRRVAVINETLANALWPGGNAIGQLVHYEQDGAREVVGVVRNVRGYAVDTAAEPQIYFPYMQNWSVPSRIVIKTLGPPEPLASVVRRELHSVEPRALVDNLQPLASHVATSIAGPRFQTWLLGIFSGSGLLLAAIGIGGVVSYAVSQRTREIGIRMALGAGPREIMRTVLGAPLVAVGIGLSAGLGLALALGRFFRSMLYEIEPQDPFTLISVTLLLAVVAVVAAAVPAGRAMRVDPVVALRAE